MQLIKKAHIDELDFHEELQKKLSTYHEKIVNPDSSITLNEIDNPYFLENDAWNISFIGSINQFEEMIATYKYATKHINFRFNNPSVNLEVKYVYYKKLFDETWLINTFTTYPLKPVTDFMNEMYPNIISLLDLEIDKLEREYLFWLNEKGYRTEEVRRSQYSKDYVTRTPEARFLRTIYTALFEFVDRREEWEKDIWNVRTLNEKYGIEYNESDSNININFTYTDERVREQVKRYYKLRLLSKNRFSMGTAILYNKTLPKFLKFIFLLEPKWRDLKDLSRHHIEKYIDYLYEYTKNDLKHPNANPENFVSRSISILSKFLEDIQRYSFEMAPDTHVRLLIFPEDRPKRRKKSDDHIDYIPDHVLEQLFSHIDYLHKDVIPVVWVAFKTGLRISDVLELTKDCLIQFNGQYSIVTDIEKVYVKGHRIPIDEQLAGILAVLIEKSNEYSNQDNNPNEYIFVRYRGRRKGNTFSREFINQELNKLANRRNITHENGSLFRFKPHQFRHTYAVKMLNGGADILTVQELLAHASPEMTLRYAKLLDDTKRKAFESVIRQDVFSFDLNGEVQEVKSGEDIPSDISYGGATLSHLWR